ncbi:hypothetical protein LXL04_027067 [Taraxacum kok-saghyz]
MRTTSPIYRHSYKSHLTTITRGFYGFLSNLYSREGKCWVAKIKRAVWVRTLADAGETPREAALRFDFDEQINELKKVEAFHMSAPCRREFHQVKPNFEHAATYEEPGESEKCAIAVRLETEKNPTAALNTVALLNQCKPRHKKEVLKIGRKVEELSNMDRQFGRFKKFAACAEAVGDVHLDVITKDCLVRGCRTVRAADVE